MNTDPKTPRKDDELKRKGAGYENFPDVTPRREGGDDALAESSPTDERSDEKVIVNEQRGNKITNGASQTEANPSEISGSDDEI